MKKTFIVKQKISLPYFEMNLSGLSLQQYYYSIYTILLILSINCCIVRSFDEIKIGALVNNKRQEENLKHNINSINEDKNVLFNTKLKPVIEYIDSDNTYKISNASKYSNF